MSGAVPLLPLYVMVWTGPAIRLRIMQCNWGFGSGHRTSVNTGQCRAFMWSSSSSSSSRSLVGPNNLPQVSCSAVSTARSFTLRPSYRPRYLLQTRLGGPQNPSRIEPQFSNCPSRSPVTILTELSQSLFIAVRNEADHPMPRLRTEPYLQSPHIPSWRVVLSG
jgi:hypothetical protein